MKPATFHLLGIAHTQTSEEYLCCAYTQKVLKMARMLKTAGHRVIHYGTEGSAVPCDEHVDVVALKTLRDYYAGHDHREQQFKFAHDDPVWGEMGRRLPAELSRRAKPKDDFILSIWGCTHHAMSRHVDCPEVEYGIGYPGVVHGGVANGKRTFKVYESHAWMNYLAGFHKMPPDDWYASVIPNYFDPRDFDYTPEKKESYALFVGRVIPSKGVQVAAQVTERLGIPLLIAGQHKNERGQVEMPDVLKMKHVQFIGSVDREGRKKLMARARFGFVPTQYLEPFGGVAVELMMSGTPVITTDWGVFPETVPHGVVGFRCRTFNEFCMAARNIGEINPLNCRRWALENFSLDVVWKKYEALFDQIQRLYHGQDWYSLYGEAEPLWRARYAARFPNGNGRQL